VSEPKRYLAKISWTQIETEEHPAGEFVRWSDYARLQAEVERLKAVSTIEQRTIQGLQRTPEWSEIARMTAYCRELEAEVERLRYVGDMLAVMVGHIEVTGDAHRMMLELSKEWNEAKEGKQS